MPRRSSCCAYRWFILCVLTFGFWLPAASHAQSSTATLRGTVEDPNGAVVADVNIALVNKEQGTQRLTTTNTEGEFIFVLLPPGKYSLTTTREGLVGIMSKHKRRQRARNRNKQPSSHGMAPTPVGARCMQRRGNSFSCVIHLVPIPINPPNRPRSFARVHRIIVEITLLILLIIGCCAVLMPKMASLLEEWQKWQTIARN